MTEQMERVTDLPRRDMWYVRVSVIDPETGADLTGPNLLPRGLGDWLKGESGRCEREPEKWYLDWCVREIRERHKHTWGYIIRTHAERRECEYVIRGGLLCLTPVQ